MATSLATIPLNLGPHRTGPAQRSGPLTVVPLLGERADAQFVPPLTGLKLSRVAGYGKVELECRPCGDGIAIVPLHIGYIQDGAQNHALCRAGLLASGQKRMFEDACCVQQSQGGYLEGREQWFFILPLALRDAALKLRGVDGYGKLWPDIARLNTLFGKHDRGHLDEIVCRERAWLTQYHSRFERIAGQTGALVFLDGKLAGIELAPNEDYFAELWPALVAFCYGVAAMRRERANPDSLAPAAPASAGEPPGEQVPLGYAATDLAGLRAEVAERRARVDADVATWLADVPNTRLDIVEEERLLDIELYTTSNAQFSGQVVRRGDRTVYASIAARPEWIAA